MNYENKRRIESLAKAACPNNKKVSVIFRSKENKLSDQELAQILNTMTKDLESLRFFGYQDAKFVNYKGEEVEA